MDLSAKEAEGPSVPGKGLVQRHGWEPREAVAQAWLAGSSTHLKTPWLGRADVSMRRHLLHVHPDEASGGQARPTLSPTPTSSREDSQFGEGGGAEKSQLTSCNTASPRFKVVDCPKICLFCCVEPRDVYRVCK